MKKFSLTDDLYTGSPLIDGDHRTLIARVNALIEAMEISQDGKRLADAMNELVAYSGEHFGREEEEMRRIDYVAMLAHQTEHAKLLKQLVGLKKMLDEGGKINTPAVAEFLGAWLHEHILSADMKLAAELKRAHATAALAH